MGELVRRRPGRPALPHAPPLCPRASARTRLFQSLMATCDELCETKGSRMGDGLRQGAVMQRRPSLPGFRHRGTHFLGLFFAQATATVHGCRVQRISGAEEARGCPAPGRGKCWAGRRLPPLSASAEASNALERLEALLNKFQ